MDPANFDFTNVVRQLATLLKINGVIITLFVVVMVLESWYSNAQRAIRGARLAREGIIKAGRAMRSLKPVDVAMRVAALVVTSLLQVATLVMCYYGGNILSIIAYPDRHRAFSAVVQRDPADLFSPGFFESFLRLDWVSAVYLLFVLSILYMSYREYDKVLGWVMAGPYTLALVVAGFPWGLSVIFAGITELFKLGSESPREFPSRFPLLFGVYGAVILAFLLYCLQCVVAVKASDFVVRIWKLPRDVAADRRA